MLLDNQDQLSGFWKGTGHVEDNAYIGTSFALRDSSRRGIERSRPQV